MARILVVDDEVNIRRMLRLALEHVGHTVGQAGDGDEGLEAFGDGEGWDLVLLDHRMPGKEGVEVLQEIRARCPAAKVILITAFGTVDLASQALRAGATDFLRKPFALEVLREAVDAALRGKAHLPQVAGAAPVPVLSFDQAGINGYRLASLPGIERRGDGTIVKVFNVHRAEGAGRACTVSLSPALIERVTAHLAGGPPPGGDAFWDVLCGEALANHLWQQASLPPGGTLAVDELTRGLERWVEAVVVQQASVA